MEDRHLLDPQRLEQQLEERLSDSEACGGTYFGASAAALKQRRATLAVLTPGADPPSDEEAVSASSSRRSSRGERAGATRSRAPARSATGGLRWLAGRSTCRGPAGRAA